MGDLDLTVRTLYIASCIPSVTAPGFAPRQSPPLLCRESGTPLF